MTKLNKQLNFILIILHFFIFQSCCSLKISENEKEKWQDKMNSTYWMIDKHPLAEKLEKYNSILYIFPENYNMSINNDDKTLFKPSKKDIEKAEQKLTDIKTNNYNTRQYLGYYSNKNEKVLLINFLSFNSRCDKKSEDYYLLDKLFFQMLHINQNYYRKIKIILKN